VRTWSGPSKQRRKKQGCVLRLEKKGKRVVINISGGSLREKMWTDSYIRGREHVRASYSLAGGEGGRTIFAGKKGEGGVVGGPRQEKKKK